TGGQRLIGGDCATDLRHTRGVGDRQCALSVQWGLQPDGELPGYVRLEDLLVTDDHLRGFMHRFRHDLAAQMSPSSVTALRSSASSAVDLSIRPRENSSISSPCTIDQLPSLVVTGNEEIRPSGTP